MQKLPKQICNTCKEAKLLIEYNFHKRTARYAPKCKSCIKEYAKDNPSEWEKIRKNTAQEHRYIMQYFPDKKHKPQLSDMGRSADGSGFSF